MFGENLPGREAVSSFPLLFFLSPSLSTCTHALGSDFGGDMSDEVRILFLFLSLFHCLAHCYGSVFMYV